MVTLDFLCANWSANSTGTATDCKEVGGYSCKSCLLVVVCDACASLSLEYMN